MFIYIPPRESLLSPQPPMARHMKKQPETPQKKNKSFGLALPAFARKAVSALALLSLGGGFSDTLQAAPSIVKHGVSDHVKTVRLQMLPEKQQASDNATVHADTASADPLDAYSYEELGYALADDGFALLHELPFARSGIGKVPKVAHSKEVGAYDAQLVKDRAELVRKPSPYDTMIRKSAIKYGVPETYLKMVLVCESELNPVARSRTGCTGIAQFAKKTARYLGLTVLPNRDDRLDPAKSIDAAAQYIAHNIDRANGHLFANVNRQGSFVNRMGATGLYYGASSDAYKQYSENLRAVWRALGMTEDKVDPKNIAKVRQNYKTVQLEVKNADEMLAGRFEKIESKRLYKMQQQDDEIKMMLAAEPLLQPDGVFIAKAASTQVHVDPVVPLQPEITFQLDLEQKSATLLAVQNTPPAPRVVIMANPAALQIHPDHDQHTGANRHDDMASMRVRDVAEQHNKQISLYAGGDGPRRAGDNSTTRRYEEFLTTRTDVQDNLSGVSKKFKAQIIEVSSAQVAKDFSNFRYAHLLHNTI